MVSWLSKMEEAGLEKIESAVVSSGAVGGRVSGGRVGGRDGGKDGDGVVGCTGG